MITLRFAAERGLVTDAIEWYGHGYWSHVDVVMGDGRLYGARFDGGVAVREADYMPVGTPTWIVHIPAPRLIMPDISAQEAALWRFLDGQIGKPYDVFDLVADFIAERDWRNPSEWFCSELIGAGLETAALLPRLVTPANRLTPDDLALVVCAVYPQG